MVDEQACPVERSDFYPEMGLVSTDFSRRELLRPPASPTTCFYSSGWARHHFLHSEAFLEMPRVLVQGVMAACITETRDLTIL